MAVYHYKVFGLTLASDIELDVLTPCAAAQGPMLRIERVTGLRPTETPPFDPYFEITPERQFMNWNAVGTFCIEDPWHVRVDPLPEVSDHLVSQAMLGLVISLVLERHGVLCLHAGAVAIEGRAAIFLGDKGAGKSTTSATLLARGHVPLTDDLVAVEGALEPQPAPHVRPGFASMKLWPDAVAALALEEDSSDRMIHPSVAKVQKRVEAPMASDPVPMGALFVLRRAAEVSTPATRRLPPHEALQMVLRYTFMARYGEARLGQAHLTGHMKRCGAVVATTPVYELMIPQDLTRLPDLAHTIEACVADTRSSQTAPSP